MNSKPYHHGDLRTAIIEKGIEVISENGVAALSLRKLAAACGVSEAAPYAHFANKKDLLGAIENHVSSKFAAVLKDSVKETGETLEGLVCLGGAFVMFFARNRPYFDLIYSHLDIKAGGEHKYEPYDFIVGFMSKLFDSLDYPKDLRLKTFIAHLSFIQGLTLTALIDNDKDVDAMEERTRDMLSSNYLLFADTVVTRPMPEGHDKGK